MGFVCVVSNGTVLGIDGGHLTIKNPDSELEYIPKETIQGISIFGKSHMTSSCIQFCLENHINVSYFTQGGRFYGNLLPVCNANILRLRKQIEMTDNADFCLSLSRKIIEAKINNQIVVAKRYLYGCDLDTKHLLFHLKNAKKKVALVSDKREVMGYEGIASRYYFQALSEVIDCDFAFQNRNKRPPKDPFNCMLSFGYSLLSKEIMGEIENRGLNAYAGVLHEDRDGHPALASDLIEEWRAVIVDSVVMSLIQGHEIKTDMFEYQEDGTCRMSSKAMKIMLVKMEKKMQTESNYLSYIKKPVTFRRAIWHQIERFAKAVELGNPELYTPIVIR